MRYRSLNDPCRGQREDQEPLEHEETPLTVEQAAEHLGISSRDTIRNWLQGGFFPGAEQAEDGSWRYWHIDIDSVRARMDELHDKNARGDLAPGNLDRDDLDLDPSGLDSSVDSLREGSMIEVHCSRCPATCLSPRESGHLPDYWVTATYRYHLGDALYEHTETACPRCAEKRLGATIPR